MILLALLAGRAICLQHLYDPLIEDLIREEAHFAKVTRTEISEAEIQEQLLLAMINEAADILGEGIAHSAAEIDLVSKKGRMGL